MEILEELKGLIRDKVKIQKLYDELEEDSIDPALKEFFRQRKADELVQQKLLADKLKEVFEGLDK